MTEHGGDLHASLHVQRAQRIRIREAYLVLALLKAELPTSRGRASDSLTLSDDMIREHGVVLAEIVKKDLSASKLARNAVGSQVSRPAAPTENPTASD